MQCKPFYRYCAPEIHAWYYNFVMIHEGINSLNFSLYRKQIFRLDYPLLCSFAQSLSLKVLLGLFTQWKLAQEVESMETN